MFFFDYTPIPRRLLQRRCQLVYLHHLDELSVILARTSRITGFTGQHGLQPLPLVITQPSTNHPDLLQISGCKQISGKVNNPHKHKY
jgi:hypothetical protein